MRAELEKRPSPRMTFSSKPATQVAMTRHWPLYGQIPEASVYRQLPAQSMTNCSRGLSRATWIWRPKRARQHNCSEARLQISKVLDNDANNQAALQAKNLRCTESADSKEKSKARRAMIRWQPRTGSALTNPFVRRDAAVTGKAPEMTSAPARLDPIGGSDGICKRQFRQGDYRGASSSAGKP